MSAFCCHVLHPFHQFLHVSTESLHKSIAFGILLCLQTHIEACSHSALAQDHAEYTVQLSRSSYDSHVVTHARSRRSMTADGRAHARQEAKSTHPVNIPCKTAPRKNPSKINWNSYGSKTLHLSDDHAIQDIGPSDNVGDSRFKYNSCNRKPTCPGGCPLYEAGVTGGCSSSRDGAA